MNNIANTRHSQTGFWERDITNESLNQGNTMQPIRQIVEDAPDFFPLPKELRHRKIEIILRPLKDSASEKNNPKTANIHYRRCRVY